MDQEKDARGTHAPPPPTLPSNVEEKKGKLENERERERRRGKGKERR